MPSASPELPQPWDTFLAAVDALLPDPRILSLDALRRQGSVRIDLGLNFVTIARVVHQGRRHLSLRYLGEGFSNPAGILISAEVTHDFPDSEASSANLRRSTARFISKVNTGTLPHS